MRFPIVLKQNFRTDSCLHTFPSFPSLKQNYKVTNVFLFPRVQSHWQYCDPVFGTLMKSTLVLRSSRS